jgi:hypothetical protein
MSWIRIKIYIVPVANGTRVSADEAHRFVDQIKNDALYGTYGTLDAQYWHDRMEFRPESLAEAEIIGEPQEIGGGLAAYEFELRLASALLPPEMGGAPHLFGMLAGDLLRFTLPPITLHDWKVKEIIFPPEWEAAESEAFRSNSIANDIRSVRTAFKLQSGMPLLAFSFKPRAGFTLKGLEEVTTEVLGAGFNVVELDTRHLALNEVRLKELVELSSRIPDKFPRHKGRLSLNLSMRSDLAIEAAETLCRETPFPTILKIDGGFNGFASVQSIRGQKLRDGRKSGPVLTCYPLMQNALLRYVPADQYVMSLAASGVDIIYPGGRPDIGGMVRSLEGAGRGNQVAPINRYRRLTQKGWPMLSTAGGIYPGQLQAFYELLGPDVAWFLGGGVALHKDGPRAGAELCVRIAKEAAERRARAGKEWSDDITEALSEQADDMFKDKTMLSDDQLRYVSPKTHLSRVHGLAPYCP